MLYVNRYVYSFFFSPETILVTGATSDEPQQWSEFELDDVKLAPQIKKILNDTQWVDDATGKFKVS